MPTAAHVVKTPTLSFVVRAYVLGILIARAICILGASESHRGHKKATRKLCVKILYIHFPHHNWKIGVAASFGQRTASGLRLRRQQQGRAFRVRPCSQTSRDRLGQGVHPTHDFFFLIAGLRHGLTFSALLPSVVKLLNVALPSVMSETEVTGSLLSPFS